MARIGALEAGGTKMVLSVGTSQGEVLEREEIPTQGPNDCVDRMVEWFDSHSVEALGIGAFGPTGVNPALLQLRQDPRDAKDRVASLRFPECL